MKATCIATICLLATSCALAAPAKLGPADLVQQAVQCELPAGKSAAVLKAVKALGGKPHQFSRHTLAFTVFGQQAAYISVTDDEVEEYAAVFPNAKLEDIAAAANLKMVGEYTRNAKKGRLTALKRNETEVWLVCTVAS